MPRVRGNFRQLIKRLPDAVTDELRVQLKATGEQVLSRARSLAPVYQGRPRKGRTPGTLRSSLSAKLLEKSLKLKVGIVGKPAAKRAYYARWVEFGHRIGAPGRRLDKQVPLRELAKPGSQRYRLLAARRRQLVRKEGVRPHPFLYTFSRAELYAPFQKLWGKALHKAAQGAADA